MSLTHDEAQVLIAAAHRRAAELGARITVAVVDEGGHLQALGRMDDAPPLSATIAATKAAGVALFRQDGGTLQTMEQSYPAFFDRLGPATGRAVLVGVGSLLLRRDDRVVGAVSVSGGLRQQDDECAEAARAQLTS